MKKYNIKKIKKDISIKKEVQADREQRRNTRIGAIVAIIAILITGVSLMKKLVIDTLAIWPETGVLYWYKIILCVVVFASIVVIFIDILIFIVNDLQRYNVKESNYKICDKESDQSYSSLINDFKVYLVVIAGLLFLMFPLNAIYGDERDRWSSILATASLSITGGLYAFYWITKNNIKVRNIKVLVSDLGYKMLKLLASFVCCLSVTVSTLLVNEALVEVNFSQTGQVEIWNESQESYTGLDIEIINVEDGSIVYSESIKEEAILWAWEQKSVNNHMGKGVDILGEKVVWKYIFSLDKEILENNRYYILVKVYQDNKSVSIKNMFYVENGQYLYTKNHIEKEY